MAITQNEKQNPIPQKLQIAIHMEAIIENLVAFHKLTREQAENGVKNAGLETNTIMLNADPYLLAWELVNGPKNRPPAQRIKQDKSVAGKIFERAHIKLMYKR